MQIVWPVSLKTVCPKIVYVNCDILFEPVVPADVRCQKTSHGLKVLLPSVINNRPVNKIQGGQIAARYYLISRFVYQLLTIYKIEDPGLAI